MLPDMLPHDHRQHYQTFRQELERLQNTSFERGSPILKDFQMLQQFFQQRILTLDLDSLEPAIATQIQSIQIEINKQLRLLATDIPFLQTARQAATAQQRQAQMHDRLKLLLQYCDVILGIAAE